MLYFILEKKEIILTKSCYVVSLSVSFVVFVGIFQSPLRALVPMWCAPYRVGPSRVFVVVLLTTLIPHICQYNGLGSIIQIVNTVQYSILVSTSGFHLCRSLQLNFPGPTLWRPLSLNYFGSQLQSVSFSAALRRHTTIFSISVFSRLYLCHIGYVYIPEQPNGDKCIHKGRGDTVSVKGSVTESKAPTLPAPRHCWDQLPAASVRLCRYNVRRMVKNTNAVGYLWSCVQG